MKTIIDPKILKGFRDSLPEPEIKRKKLFNMLEKTFSSFGFVPIDTPVLEYTEVLLGKGGGETDKQVYSFKDHGNRNVAMRFDLTVPFARFVAANKSKLYFPFKRFHISKVWRGENTQRGRYREFYQCDFDIVGTDTPSADLEILLLMIKSMETLNISNFKIHISNRGILNNFLAKENLTQSSAEIMRTIDKIDKIGEPEVLKILKSIAGNAALKIVDYIKPEKTSEETLEKITQLSGGSSPETDRLLNVYNYLKDNSREINIVINPSITRGLDYYTGIVFETFLDSMESIGSVCSGGRYNNLASVYTSETIPGVGASIGIDRLLAALEEINRDKQELPQCECIVFNIDESLTGYLHKTASLIREKGISCEVYHENRKLPKQFQYAEKKNIPAGVIIGSDEYKNSTITVKDLFKKENYENLDTNAGIEKILTIIREWRKNGTS